MYSTRPPKSHSTTVSPGNTSLHWMVSITNLGHVTQGQEVADHQVLLIGVTHDRSEGEGDLITKDHNMRQHSPKI